MQARRLSESEEPKIAEATKEAEGAQRARQEAEQRLAEIRSRIEAQQRAQTEALKQSQAAEAGRQQELKRQAAEAGRRQELQQKAERDKTDTATPPATGDGPQLSDERFAEVEKGPIDPPLGGSVDDLAQRFNQQARKLKFEAHMSLDHCETGPVRMVCAYQISNELRAVASARGNGSKELDGVVFFFGGKDANAVEFMATIVTAINRFAPNANSDERGQQFRSLFFNPQTGKPALPIPDGQSRDATLHGVKFSVRTPTNMGIWFSITKI